MWRAKQTLWCYIKTEDISVSTHISINRNKYGCECIHTYSCMTPFEFGQKTPMASVSIGEAEGDMTLQHVPAPSLQ